MRGATHPVLARMGTALLAVALTVGGTVALPAVAAAADVTDGLVLRYDLTQTTGHRGADASGNGRDGTLSGDATWSADRASRSTAPTATSSCPTTSCPGSRRSPSRPTC